MHLSRDSKVWTTDLLQRKRRHYQTGLTSSCIVPSTTERSRRRLVQCPTRHWWHQQRSWHNHIYWLRHRALGLDTHISLEPLLDRGTPHHKPSRGLAQQDKEESSTCPSQHLRDHRLTPDHKSHYRGNYHPVCSRRSPPTHNTNLQTHRLQTSATETDYADAASHLPHLYW